MSEVDVIRKVLMARAQDALRDEALDALERLKQELKRVENALNESVILQSHYARILNDHDGGKRLDFADAWAWMERLDNLKGEQNVQF